MTGFDPSPRYALLRVITLSLATLAMTVAVTGVASRASVLAWAVATMALITFGATYHVKH